jgi:hypothetical protein
MLDVDPERHRLQKGHDRQACKEGWMEFAEEWAHLARKTEAKAEPERQ